MRRNSDQAADRARKAFCRCKITALGEVAELIRRSIHTARRRLKQWRASNSYNRNGRYHTLPDVPEFDVNGLWRWRGVFFSQYGNLKQTVMEMVRRSRAGLDAAGICALLGVAPRSFLSGFANDPRPRREKTRGRFVCYSSDPVIYSGQLRQRGALILKDRPPTASEAIAILVETIKHPALDHAALSRRLRRQQVFVETGAIRNFFLRHGLTVKKTPHSI